MTDAAIWDCPNRVHLDFPSSGVEQLIASARLRFWRVVELSLGSVPTARELGGVLADEFDYPRDYATLDSAIDMIPDFDVNSGNDPSPAGLLVVIGDPGPPAVAECIFKIAPYILDRVRSRGRLAAFVFLAGGPSAREWLESSNRRLEEAGAVEWAVGHTGRVGVVEHRGQGGRSMRGTPDGLTVAQEGDSPTGSTSWDTRHE